MDPTDASNSTRVPTDDRPRDPPADLSTRWRGVYAALEVPPPERSPPPRSREVYNPPVRTATERRAPGETAGGGTLSVSSGSGKSVPPSESGAASQGGVSGDGGAQPPTTHMSTSTTTDETAGSTRDDQENDLVTDGGHVEPIDVSGGNAPDPEPGEPVLEPRARVVDREQPPEERSAAIVLELPGEAAGDYRIDAIDATVADVNPEYDPERPVAVIAFEDALETHGADDVRRYSYPVDRLQPVGEEWSPVTTSGARERREILDDHGEAVDAFGDVLEALLTDTADVTTRLLRALKWRAKPETRGDCRHSKDDKYRPENDDALCCWECSTDLPRPKKFDRNDAAGSTCRTGDPVVTREVLADWMDTRATSLSDPRAGVATDYRPWRFASDLKGLGSDTDRIVRTSAVRLAYNATLAGRLDEEYNYQRAVALLRDRGIDTDALLPGGDRQ